MLLSKDKRILVLGVFLLAVSFFILSRVDPMAKNFAGRIVSFSFVLSWGLIIYGLLKGDKK